MDYTRMMRDMAQRVRQGAGQEMQGGPGASGMPGASGARFRGFGLAAGPGAPWAEAFRRPVESGDGFADYTAMRAPQAGGAPRVDQEGRDAAAHFELMQRNAQAQAEEQARLQQTWMDDQTARQRTWMDQFLDQQRRRDDQLMQFFR